MTQKHMKLSRVLSLVILLGFSWLPLTWSAEEPAKGIAAPKELSLISTIPEEGFQVALRLARLGVTETQPNREALKEGRKEYATDPESLIAASHVVAVHFQTVAAANNYWREKTPEKDRDAMGER